MRLKSVWRGKKQVVVLVGKVENDDENITAINRVLVQLDKHELKPFPYKDCGKLSAKIKRRRRVRGYNGFQRKQKRVHYSNCFSADLNHYFSQVYALAIHGEGLYQRPLEDLEYYQRWIESSFYERFPQYEFLKRLISTRTTPALHEYLVLHDELRALLQKIFPEMIEKNRSVEGETK